MMIPLHLLALMLYWFKYQNTEQIMEWAEVVDNPLLQDLPFKIELNKFEGIINESRI